MASELDEFEDDFMLQDYLNSLNSSYFGGPGFALPDIRGGSKEPINILVDNIPCGLNRDGLIRAFKFAAISPINCKIFKTNSDRQKAIVQVKTTTDATTAIQALNLKRPLNLKITLAANKGEFERKKEEILREQRKELTRHLNSLVKPSNRMGDLVNNLLAVENLVKILPSPGANCFACEAEPLVRHVHFIAPDEKVFDPFEGLPGTVPVNCSYCSTNEGKFVICSQCRVVAYCGLRCQVLAWSHHRNVCSPHPKILNGKNPDPNPGKKPEKVQEKVQEKIQEKVPEKVKTEEVSVQAVKKTAETIVNPPSSKPVTNDNRPRADLPAVNSGFLIEEPNRIIMPKPKISLNNEITFLRETKLNCGETIEVVASFIESPSEFYVQRIQDSQTLDDITTMLNKSCSESGEWPGAEKLKSGHYCAAKNVDDDLWYRVKVLKNEGTEAIVEFIDFGNSETVPIQDLRPLPPKLSTIPTLACCCSLKYAKPLYESEWALDACRFVENMFYESNTYKHCKVINEIDGVYQVELYSDQGATLSDLLVQKGLAKRYEEIRKPLNRNLRRNFPQNEPGSIAQKSSDSTERGTVRVFESKNKYESEVQSYIPKYPRSIDRNEIRIENDRRINDSVPVSPPRPAPKKIVSPTEAYKLSQKVCPANFYHLYEMTPLKSSEPVLLCVDSQEPSLVYALGDNDSMLSLYAGLAHINESSPKITPKPGLFGVAKAEDEDYYRVLVLEMLNNGKCRCFFPDFGNTDQVNSSLIYQLPKEISFEKLPAQAIRCRVENADKIPDYLKKIEHAIGEGTPVKAKITRTISQHEFGIELMLND